MKKLIILLIVFGILLIGFVAGTLIGNKYIPDSISTKYPVIEQQLSKSKGNIDTMFMPYDYGCVVVEDILIDCDKDGNCKIPRESFINIKCTDQKG